MQAWLLLFTALALRLPALFHPQALAPATPLGPLPLWLQPWLDSLPQAGGPLWLGLLQAAADALSALLLMRLVERRRLAERLLASRQQAEGWAAPGFWVGLAWAANPVAGLLAGPAGAWQSLALLGLLSAAWNLEFSTHPAAERRAAWGFGLAIGAALWPLLLLPLGANGLLSRRARGRFYGRALLWPLLLLLPWLLLKDSTALAAAWLGPPSSLGVPGLLSSLCFATGVPAELLRSLLGFWPWVSLVFLLLYALVLLARPPALLPGLGVAAWVWLVVAPQPQAPLFLAPLGLLLLVPGRLAWRMLAASFILLVLQRQLPGPGLDPAYSPSLLRTAQLAWAALLLVWLLWSSLECLRLSAYARRP